MKTRISWTLTILFLAALCLSYNSSAPVYAGPPFKGTDYVSPDTIQCAINSVAGSFAAAQSTYNVQGNCQVNTKQPDPKGGSTFPDRTDAFNWTAVGTYLPGKYNTTETISVSRPSSTQFTVTVIATITSTMLCGKDPWLQPDGLSCGSVRYQQTGTLGTSDGDQLVQAYLSATNPVVPRSSMLTAQQRATLNQEYQRSVANLMTKPAIIPPQNTAAATPNSSNLAKPSLAAMLTAPVIISPTANSSNYEGRFQVKGTVTGSYTGAEMVYVQFTFLGTATTPAPNAFVNIFNISLKDLLNGITVPNTITRGGMGRWQVRAQVFNPNAGPWGPTVTFNLAQLGSTVIPLNKR